MKIANDVRWLASGPRSGLGKLLFQQMSQEALLCQVK